MNKSTLVIVAVILILTIIFSYWMATEVLKDPIYDGNLRLNSESTFSCSGEFCKFE